MTRRMLGSLLLAGALAASLSSASAQFDVKEGAPTLVDRVIHVNTQFDLTLNPKIEEALSKGIPIDIVIDIKLLRKRWWWRDVLITDWTLTRRLQFHALSRQYLVTSPQEERATESFSSLAQALDWLGDVRDLRIPLTAKKELLPDARHLVSLRARLDIEALPVIMRPLAYATPSWRLNTGWREWPVTP